MPDLLGFCHLREIDLPRPENDDLPYPGKGGLFPDRMPFLRDDVTLAWLQVGKALRLISGYPGQVTPGRPSTVGKPALDASWNPAQGEGRPRIRLFPTEMPLFQGPWLEDGEAVPSRGYSGKTGPRPFRRPAAHDDDGRGKNMNLRPLSRKIRKSECQQK